MADNGGELTIGQRLFRIEERLDAAFKEVSIERHRVTNILQIEKLQTDILATLKDHNRRLTELERSEMAEEAVTQALTAAKREAESNKKWVIGTAVSLGALMVMIVGLLASLLGKV